LDQVADLVVFIIYFADAFSVSALPFQSDDHSAYTFSGGHFIGVYFTYLHVCQYLKRVGVKHDHSSQLTALSSCVKALNFSGEGKVA